MAISRGRVVVGEKYNRLTAVEFIGLENSQAIWLWKCDCDNELKAAAGKVRYGSTKSCGCLSREQASVRLKTHGMFGSPEYGVWGGMIQRCTNEKSTCYVNYGGRGIQICQQWLDSFESFFADMGHRPGPGYEIDRINNDGNYEPGNCQWVPKAVQSTNRRSNVLILYKGKVMIMKHFADFCGLPYPRVRYLLGVGHSPDFIYENRNVDLHTLRKKIKAMKNG